MNKTFNITGTCFPDRHYMVDTSEKLAQILAMIDTGDYFCINRARQYGKSTTLNRLAELLSEKYIVFSLSFQRMSSAKFKDEDTFCRAFTERLLRYTDARQPHGLNLEIMERLASRAADYTRSFDLTDMFDIISDLCVSSSRPIVLMIDETDNACNNQIFIDFLGQIRDLYLNREVTPSFQSVILAGVYNIKNLKLKIRDDSSHRYNSPWNIAADFTVDMHFSADGIAGMLKEYETDHMTGMDIAAISQLIYDYSGGYPYIVSCICKILDENTRYITSAPDKTNIWTKEGVLCAIRTLLKDPSTLFDDMIKKLYDHPKLKEKINDILFRGIRYTFEIDNPEINVGVMFGFLKDKNNEVAVANRIFETKLYNLLLSESENSKYDSTMPDDSKNQFIVHGRLQMKLVMQKFYQYFTELCTNSDEKFVEDEGRKIFLMFLRPIINGSGNYYIEAQTRDRTRTDVITDYKGQQFIIELKLWHGDSYNKRGEKQLFEYLELYNQDEGYLLSFNFNKHKKTGIHEIKYGDKWIMEIVV